jgi:Methyltransferase domain
MFFVLSPDISFRRIAAGWLVTRAASFDELQFTQEEFLQLCEFGLAQTLQEFARDGEGALDRQKVFSRFLAQGLLVRSGLRKEIKSSQLDEVLRELAVVTDGLTASILAADQIEFDSASRHRAGATLTSVLAELRNLKSLMDLEQSRVVHLKLTALRQTHPVLRLNLGSGEKPIPGWINLGAPPADISMDLRLPMPFLDGEADAIYCSHVAEHLYFPNQLMDFLRECARILRRGRPIRLVVPDIGAYLRAYAQGDTIFFTDRKKFWPTLPDDILPLEHILSYAGAFSSPASFLESHKYGFDYALLEKYLLLSGFSRVRRCTYNGSNHAELLVDTYAEKNNAHSGFQPYSLFVEAIR